MTPHFGHRATPSEQVDPVAPVLGEQDTSLLSEQDASARSMPQPGEVRNDPAPLPIVPVIAPTAGMLIDPHGTEEDADGRTVQEMIRDLVHNRLDPVVTAQSTGAELKTVLERMVSEVANEHRILLNSDEQYAVSQELINDIVGLGPLEPLLRDDSSTDILVNGAGQIFVEQHGKLKLTDVKFRSDAHVMHVAQRVATSIGRRIDLASPMLDARLADGSRVNVIFAPVSIDGPCISIRKFSRDFLGFDQMLAHDSLSPKLARFLEIVTRCRLNIVISGGTGSGKTTLLGAMSKYIDPQERVITIEDSAELRLQLPHRIRLETRQPSIEGTGEITQRDLLRNALRMRPDRIIVGEVRGSEAFDMLQAMNTGHKGSMSTIHANSPRDALTRIENMVLMATANLPSRAIMSQIVGALQLVVQVERMRDGARRVIEVSEIVGIQGETVTMSTLFSHSYEGEAGNGLLEGTFVAGNSRPSFLPRIAYYQMADALVETMT